VGAWFELTLWGSRTPLAIAMHSAADPKSAALTAPHSLTHPASVYAETSLSMKLAVVVRDNEGVARSGT